jgi:hypothetical protein
VAQLYPRALGFLSVASCNSQGYDGGILTHLHTGFLKSKSYYGRQSASQSVLVSGIHLGPAANFSHSLFDYFFDSCRFVDVGSPL